MRIKRLFQKPKPISNLNPKNWISTKSRLILITTHTYNGEPLFQIPEVVHYFKIVFYLVAYKHNIELLKVGCDYTHTHFIIRQQSQQDIRKIVGLLKGGTSLKMRKNIIWLRRYPRFWAKGFYVTFLTVDKGAIRYLENQHREQEERFKLR